MFLPGKSSSPDFENETPPPIGYVWIGPPTLSDKNAAVYEHDIMGPIHMANANHYNPIIFYCLDEYSDQYKKIFAELNHPEIEVKPIQTYLKTLKTNPNATPELIELIEELEEIITNLSSEDRNSIRDRVSIKNAVVLFNLFMQKGYLFDTNVLPIKSKLALHEESKSAFPRVDGDDDCWAIFVPQNLSVEKAKIPFERFYEQYKEFEKIYKAEGETSHYHMQCAIAIVSSLKKLSNATRWESGLQLKRPHINSVFHTDTQEKKSVTNRLAAIVKLKIGIKKYYFNTHKDPLPDSELLKGTKQMIEVYANSHPSKLGRKISVTTESGKIEINIIPPFLANIWHELDKIEYFNNNELKKYFNDLKEDNILKKIYPFAVNLKDILDEVIHACQVSEKLMKKRSRVPDNFHPAVDARIMELNSSKEIEIAIDSLKQAITLTNEFKKTVLEEDVKSFFIKTVYDIFAEGKDDVIKTAYDLFIAGKREESLNTIKFYLENKYAEPFQPKP